MSDEQILAALKNKGYAVVGKVVTLPQGYTKRDLVTDICELTGLAPEHVVNGVAEDP